MSYQWPLAFSLHQLGTLIWVASRLGRPTARFQWHGGAPTLWRGICWD